MNKFRKYNIKTKQGITLHCEDAGKKSQPTVVLIMGLGSQLTAWPDAFYYGLVDKGFRVIRFDNRDVGKSSHLDHHGSPSVIKTWLTRKFSFNAKAPYNLDDMANDVLALMKALNIKKAHLVGASMGGMIAQILAAKHKKSVLSLVSIMSTTGAIFLSKQNVPLILKLAKYKQHDLTSAIEFNVTLNKLIGSNTYLPKDDVLRAQAAVHLKRAHNPAGMKRQLAAITATGCRRHLMPKIKVPTLVIHGENDPLIPLAKGKETASQIKKAKLKVISKMAHDFPAPLMKKLTKQIAKHIKKAERKRQIKKRKKLTALSS